MQEVTIPALGMAMTEAVLSRWYMQPGDPVSAGDMLAEVETDKSVIALESPADGTLGRHLVNEGDAVPVGDPVVRILAAGETEAQSAAPSLAAVMPGASDTGSVPSADGEPPSAGTPPSGRAPHTMSPRQRRQARLAAEQGETPAAAATGPDPSRTRRAIAERVSQSWREIPHFAVTREIDATQAQAALGTVRSRGIHATFTDLLLRALALAVREVIGGDGDVGLAVATAAGVQMPVLTGIPCLDAAGLAAARTAAVQRARDGRPSSTDLAGNPVASLSNLGSRGVDAFTGVIAVGQQLLLTAGSIRPRPAAVDGGLAIRPTLVATLNVDHRSFDGDRAADVLAAFAQELDSLRAWAERGNA